MTSPPSRPRGTLYPQSLPGLHTLHVKTLVLGIVMWCLMYIPNTARTTPSYSDLPLAIIPNPHRECHIPAHPYRNEAPAGGSEPHVRDHHYCCTLQCSPQEQQRNDDLHAAYAAWSDGALPMGRPSPAIAARPSTRDAAAAGGDAFIIIFPYLLLYTARLAMLPVTPVALLLMATPASAEQEFDSTQGSPGAPGAPTTHYSALMLVLGTILAMGVLARRYRHGYTRLPAGAPPRDSPPGPPDQYSGYSTEIGPTVLEVQAHDPTTKWPIVVNGYRLDLSSTSAAGYLGIKAVTTSGITKYVARGRGREYLGTYDCRIRAALERAISFGGILRVDHEDPPAAIGDIGDTNWEHEWDQHGPAAENQLGPDVESGLLLVSPAGIPLHLSVKSQSGYTGVCATKINRSRSSNRTRDTEQWYAAKYKGKLLKRPGGKGEFRSAVEAAEAYARAFAVDHPQNQVRVLRCGGAGRHAGACAFKAAGSAIAAARSYCHGGAVAETSQSASADVRAPAPASADELERGNGVAVTATASPMQPGDPGFDPDFQSLLELSQSALPPPLVGLSLPPSPPMSPPAPACPPAEPAALCAACGVDARGIMGDALSCPHCEQILCPEHYPPEMHGPCRSTVAITASPPSSPPSSPRPPSTPLRSPPQSAPAPGSSLCLLLLAAMPGLGTCCSREPQAVAISFSVLPYAAAVGALATLGTVIAIVAIAAVVNTAASLPADTGTCSEKEGAALTSLAARIAFGTVFAGFDAAVAVVTVVAVTSTAVVVAVADATAFASVVAAVVDAAFAAADATILAVAFAAVGTVIATSATVVPVLGSSYRRLLPMVIFGCMAQGCSAGPPDAKMMGQLAELSSSFGLATLLTGLASIAVTPTARNLINSAADACSVTSDSSPDDAATFSLFSEGTVAPTSLTAVKEEGVALPPGLYATAISRPRTRSNKEGVGRRTLRSTQWTQCENTEWAKQPRRARQPVYTAVHCGRIWLQRTQAARARRRDTSQPPVPILRDVGFDANSSMFTYRDAQGHTTFVHPALTGTTPTACDADGHEVTPVQPPQESSIVLCPESTGKLCYYDTQTGVATWLPPPGSGPLEQLTKSAVACLPQRSPPQLPGDLRLGQMHTQASGWFAVFQDADDSVTLYHVATGTLREAPWVALRTPDGVIYFGNLVSRETRWLPPHLWQEGFISRHSLRVLDDPYDELVSRGLVDHRTSLPRQLARMRVEGGAPYRLDVGSGTPRYPPDEFDTPCTYPLAGYVSAECSRSHLGEMLWVPDSASIQGGTPAPFGYARDDPSPSTPRPALNNVPSCSTEGSEQSASTRSSSGSSA